MNPSTERDRARPSPSFPRRIPHHEGRIGRSGARCGPALSSVAPRPALFSSTSGCGMTGTQFLIEALKLYPDARRVLLTAYADTEAAITAINKIGLDHHLLKPWEPPEQRLYPVLDDLLAEWMARTRPPFEGIRVPGTALSASSYAVKDFLSRNLIPPVGRSRFRRARASSFNRQPTACRGCRSSCFKTARRWCSRRRASSPRDRDADTPSASLLRPRRHRRRTGRACGSGVWRLEGLRTILVERDATGDRQVPAHRSRTTWGFRAGSRAQISRVAPPIQPSGLEPRSYRRRTSPAFAATTLPVSYSR